MFILSNILRKIKGILSYFYRNYIAPRLYDVLDHKVLSKNLELKNKYTNRRCFIIGGGPSVADINLSRLSNEYTFVMSEFEKHPQYNDLVHKFHIIADSNYFTEGQTEHWPRRFKEKDHDIPTDTTIIINRAAKPFIDKYNLFKNHQVYFMGTQGIFTDNLPFNINIDHYVPQPKNSVLMCMMAAVWMGFNEIYLLGCEHNFLASPLGRGKSSAFIHGYDDGIPKLDTADSEIIKKYINQKELRVTYETNMANMVQLFRSYRLFYAKARKTHPSLQIFNTTPNSFLDVFPMIDFEDIKGL